MANPHIKVVSELVDTIHHGLDLSSLSLLSFLPLFNTFESFIVVSLLGLLVVLEIGTLSFTYTTTKLPKLISELLKDRRKKLTILG